MKTLTRLIGVIGFVVTTVAQGGVQITQTGSQTVYSVKLDGVAFSPIKLGGKSFATANLIGADRYAGILYDLGRPELPVLRFIVDGDVSVDVGGAQVEGIINDNVQVKPSQPSWSKSETDSPALAYQPQSYQVHAFTNVPPYETQTVGSFRGVPRRMVTLYPMTYNPAEGAYRLTKSFKVTVKTTHRTEPSQQTMALVIGAQFAESPSLARLVKQKTAQGFNVRSLVVGRDMESTPQAIRKALKQLYADQVNLRFALLIGDAEDVPAYDSTHIYGVTDHYYRAIDTDDYEADINAPDIGVGRISVGTEVQLAAVVDKIERYATGSFNQGSRPTDADDWMRHPAFISTHDRYQVAEATHSAVIAEHFAPRDYLRVFPDATEKGGDKLFPISLGATKRQIVSHMAQGRFIINFSGHGSYSGWEDVTTDDVLSIENTDALPWVLSNSCITGAFTEEPVFAETWLRHPNGAIVFWGSMDSSYWDEDDILEKAAYASVFNRGVRAFDLIHQAALGEVWRYYGGANRSKYYWETYVTFGDPSLSVRLGKTQAAAVEGLRTIRVGQRSAAWNVLTAGKPAVGTTITLLREADGVMAVGQTNQDGVAEINLSAFGATSSQLRLFVYGPDLRAVAGDVELVSSK